MTRAKPSPDHSVEEPAFSSEKLDRDWLDAALPNAALSFRGYNVTNLGRTPELLAHPAYGPIVRQYLRGASEVCADVVGKRVDLVRRVQRKQEPSLKTYHEAVSLIVGVEMVQLKLLEEFHGIDYRRAKLSFGYSLGEIVAAAVGGLCDIRCAATIPIAMAPDCSELARDVTMGIVISRGPALDLEAVERLCIQITAEGKGTIGMSAILSPNSVLVLGQGHTIERFKEETPARLSSHVHVRINTHRWPPMHTPIVRQRHIPDRSSAMLASMPGWLAAPHPPVLSLVTGKMSYNDYNAREILRKWVDHPQRLWDAVCGTLAAGVKTIVHVGPEPNLVPATFKRLADNIHDQISRRSLGGLGLRAVSGMVRRQWLSGVLPSRTALLRAPMIRQINLEDWLLDAPL